MYDHFIHHTCTTHRVFASCLSDALASLSIQPLPSRAKHCVCSGSATTRSRLFLGFPLILLNEEGSYRQIPTSIIRLAEDFSFRGRHYPHPDNLLATHGYFQITCKYATPNQHTLVRTSDSVVTFSMGMFKSEVNFGSADQSASC